MSSSTINCNLIKSGQRHLHQSRYRRSHNTCPSLLCSYANSLFVALSFSMPQAHGSDMSKRKNRSMQTNTLSDQPTSAASVTLSDRIPSSRSRANDEASLDTPSAKRQRHQQDASNMQSPSSQQIWLTRYPFIMPLVLQYLSDADVLNRLLLTTKLMKQPLTSYGLKICLTQKQINLSQNQSILLLNQCQSNG
jgi:hypothetical protein